MHFTYLLLFLAKELKNKTDALTTSEMPANRIVQSESGSKLIEIENEIECPKCYDNDSVFGRPACKTFKMN